MIELVGTSEDVLPPRGRGRPPLWTEAELDQLVLELLDNPVLTSPTSHSRRTVAKRRAERLAAHMEARGMPCSIRVWQEPQCDTPLSGQWRWAIVRNPGD
jgi:hypothetical protein